MPGPADIAAVLAARYEGFRSRAYWDADGRVWTVGYGTTEIDGRPVREGDVVTEPQAQALLAKRLNRDLPTLQRALGKATDNQLAAFLDLAYNCGIGVKTSTAAKLHIAGDRLGAARAFLMWCKAGGREMAGLLRRRCAEAELYLTP
ncbi:lysozyme [Roseomonas sp. WA12]